MQPREKVQEEGEGEGRVQGRRREERGKGGGGQSSGKEEGRVRERILKGWPYGATISSKDAKLHFIFGFQEIRREEEEGLNG